MGGGLPSFQRASAGGVPTMMHYGNPASAGLPSQQRGGAMGAGAGMVMRPAGVGAGIGGVGPVASGAGKVIPDVGVLGAKPTAGAAGGWSQGQEKAQGQSPQAPKVPDSFSFVMDAMQDSIK